MDLTASPLLHPKECDAFLPSGGKPGTIILRGVDGESPADLPCVGEIMSITMQGDASSFELADCRVIAVKPKTGRRSEHTIVLQDERWKWQHKFAIGTYNQEYNGFGMKTEVKTASDLWSHLSTIGGISITVGAMHGVSPAVRWAMVRMCDAVDFLCEATGSSCVPVSGGGVRVGKLSEAINSSFDDGAMRKPIAMRTPATVRMVAGPTVNVELVSCTQVLPNEDGEIESWGTAGYDIDDFFDGFSGAPNQLALQAAAFRLLRANVTGKWILPAIPGSFAGIGGAASASIKTVTREDWDDYKPQVYVDPGSNLLVSSGRKIDGTQTDYGIGTTYEAWVATVDGTYGTRDVAVGGPGGTVEWHLPWVQARTGLMGAVTADDVLSPYDAVALAKFRAGTTIMLPDIVSLPTQGEVTGIRLMMRTGPVRPEARTTVWTVHTPRTADSNFWLKE